MAVQFPRDINSGALHNFSKLQVFFLFVKQGLPSRIKQLMSVKQLA